MQSKLVYLAATPDIKGMHEKALLTASLFGLPMFGVNMGGTRDTTSNPGSIVDDTSGSPASADVDIDTSDTDSHGAGGASYLSRLDGTASSPGNPALPRFVKNVGVGSKVLRGIGFLGGNYQDEAGVTPLIGAPGTEFGGAQVPFTSPTFYPARQWLTSYFGELSGGSTNLIATPGQHRVADAGRRDRDPRVFSNLQLRLFYVDDEDPDAAQATAPRIFNVTSAVNGGNVDIAADITGNDEGGNDNVNTAWVTFTFADGSWRSVDLTRGSGLDARHWTAASPWTGPRPPFGSSSRPSTALPWWASTTTPLPTTRSPRHAPRCRSHDLTINGPAAGAHGLAGGSQVCHATRNTASLSAEPRSRSDSARPSRP